MGELEAFREEVRSWLSACVPKSLFGRPFVMLELAPDEPAELRADRARYLQLMLERGFTAPTWPKRLGGAELSGPQTKILTEELARLRLAPPLAGMGLTMIGPTLLVHGSEAQQQTFLPKIVTGEHRWCQGFSEPNAGSDLAALRTSAKLDASGRGYVINGSKIWTSGAQFADWMFMLVRTDESSKHNGITFLLLDMKTPGIDVRPIKLISGHSMFCEVFFTDVVAEAEHVVGGVNQGWTVAKTLLNFERSGMGTGALGGGGRRGGFSSGTRIADFAKQAAGERDGRIADASIRDQVVGLLLDELAFSLTLQRSAETRKATGAPGAEISMLKLYQSELGQRRDELTLSLSGTAALVAEPGAQSAAAEGGSGVAAEWLRAKATTIYGGSSEIQRNIIAKRVLKLPAS